MKVAAFVFLLLVSVSCFAQNWYGYAVINDPDGYTNIRQKPDKTSPVITKLNNGALVYCFTMEGKDAGWFSATVCSTPKEQNGFVYKNRITPVENYPTVPITKEEDDAVTLSNGKIKVVLTRKAFDPAKNKLTYYEDNSAVLTKINGKSFWGTDGGVPDSEYQSVIIETGGKKITLPTEALESLYQPSLSTTQVNYDAAQDSIYISTFNSDGAGGYAVLWKIEKGIYKERAVINGF